MIVWSKKAVFDTMKVTGVKEKAVYMRKDVFIKFVAKLYQSM